MDSVDIIFKYFPELSDTQKKQMEQLGSLYELWNAQINVISRKDMEHFYEKHVLHSLGIAKIMKFVAGTDVLDVGTGGGFPGIPLAIMFPEVKFHLVDSVGKKIKVVQEVSDALGLKNVIAEHHRAEKIEAKFDFVISRAVTRMAPFIDWIKYKFNNNHYNDLHNGILYLKGGDLEEEMAETKRSYTSHNLKEYFSEDFYETKKVIYVPFK